MARIQGFAIRSIAVVQDIGFVSRFIEIDGRVNSPHLGYLHRVAPRSGGILGRSHEVAVVVDIGAGDVEGTLVVADGRCEQTARQAFPHEVHLFGPIDDIADLLPVFEVLAVKNRDAGEIGKGGIDQVVVISGARDAGIRVKASQDGVDQGGGLRHGDMAKRKIQTQKKQKANFCTHVHRF